MALGELLGGALSIVVQVLFEGLASQFMVPSKRKRQNEERHKQFETKLQSAIVLLRDAEEKQLTDEHARNWLHNLNEVIYKADELKDDIEYEKLGHQREGDSIWSTVEACFGNYVEERITQIGENMDRLIEEMDGLGLKENSRRSQSTTDYGSHGPPLADESTVYGRKEEIKAIMTWIQSDNKPMVIPIVGMAGIGKTTLAQLVFNDGSLDFEEKVWVSVSTDSNVFNITKRIFKEVTSMESSNDKLFQLQIELKNALKRKKFLFVLDDVENASLWDDLKIPFTSGASGSKIIITTRRPEIAKIVNANPEEHCNLRGLSDHDCLDFFSQYAFNNEDLNAHQDLREIGKEIVRKCGGLPLAVKSVATLLRTLPSLEDWRTILEKKIWDSKLQENTSQHILPALLLSYSDLSPQLRKCFAYCSIFPKDYEFTEKELILLWIAEGFLHPEKVARMEDVGKEYFKILKSRSFFQPGKSESSFIMHGCMHDLATFVLGDFGFRLEKNDLDELSERARHFSIMKKDVHHLKQTFDAKVLHTFLTLNSNASPDGQHEVQLPELKSEEKRLRVVSLSHYRSIEHFPAYVENSKQLRYLDLSFTAIREIPSTICSLFKLETLLLRGCTNLTRLPAEVGGLLKLRHLNFDGSRIEEFPLQIGGLKHLQTLSKFIVCEEDGGSWIKGLGDLQHLRGKFDIWGLENVVDVVNVSAAKLSDKEFLTRLGLHWQGDSAVSSDPEKHRQVLDLLRPCKKLEELYISGYNGRSFSDWMGDQCFHNIERVELVKCGNCNSLSPIEQLPSLKKLVISRWPVATLRSEFNSNGSSMTEAFKHLECLSFQDMLNWKEWLITDGAVFPRLEKLEFRNCPKLEMRLPDCFPALTKLVVNRCRQLRPFLTPENTHRGGGFSSLEELEISECPEQRYFSNEELRLTSSVDIRTPDRPPNSGD